MQHVSFQLIIQFIFLSALFISAYFAKVTGFKRTMIIVLCIDLIFSVWINSPYTIHYNDFYIKDLKTYENTFPKGFPNPSEQTIFETNPKGYKAYWRNLCIFYKQIGKAGYNPFQLAAYDSLERNEYLYNTLLNNKSYFISDEIFSLDNLQKHLSDSNLTKNNIYLSDKDYMKLNKSIGKLSNSDNISLVSYKPNHIKIRYQIKEPVVFIFLQNYFPGWKAMINNKRVPIYKANKTFMGVLLQPGTKEVQIIYRPIGEMICFAISAMTFFVYLTLILISETRKKPGNINIS